MSVTELGRLFDTVPSLAERPARRRGREVPDGFVPDIASSEVISDPKLWLSRYHIPIVEVLPCDLKGAAAAFWWKSRGGEFIEAEVRIPRGTDINDAGARWCVWHELGHAMDYVTTREERLISTPHGHFSTQHIKLLREHQETIITWTPSDDRDYKVSPCELWAECVACAIMLPEFMPAPLLDGIRESLRSRNLPA